LALWQSDRDNLSKTICDLLIFAALLIACSQGQNRGRPVTAERLDDLLSRMGAIATAVNAFTSEAVQLQALEALVEAYSGAPPKSASSQPAEVDSPPDASLETAKGKTKNKGRKPRAGSATKEHVEIVRGLDLRPAGKKSFPDFIGEKKPPTNQDKFAVAVYWLEQIAEATPITMGHVAGIFRQTAGWKEPGNMRVGLTTTASRKNTIDTSDLNSIRTTPHGRNFVEHDLPAQS
jgi:hypothetical protein